MFDRVLNIPGFYICLWFWLCEGYEYVGVTQDSEYAWLISKPAWMAFILIPHYNLLSIWICGYLFQCLYKTRSFSLKDYDVVIIKDRYQVNP